MMNNNNALTVESMDILGIIISVTIKKGYFCRKTVEDELKKYDLQDFSPSLKNKTEFLRAIDEMRRENDRLVRKVEEDEDRIIYQFTLEEKVNKELEYNKEAVVYFYKNDGDILCTDTKIQDMIIQKISSHKDMYNEKDVYGIMTRIFDKKCFSITCKKGIKFVHAKYIKLMENFESFLSSIGIKDEYVFTCYVPDLEKSKNKIKKAFFLDMENRIEVIKNEIIDITSKEKISQRALNNRLDKIKENKEMLEMYSDVLQAKVTSYSDNLEKINQDILTALQSVDIDDCKQTNNQYRLNKTVNTINKEVKLNKRTAFDF